MHISTMWQHTRVFLLCFNKALTYAKEVRELAVIRMTHDPETLETGTGNQLNFSGAGFWYVCHANMGLDASDFRFHRRLEHCYIPSQKVAVCD